MGFFSETVDHIDDLRGSCRALSIPSIWDFSLKRVVVYPCILSGCVKVFQFPLYGIFLWNRKALNHLVTSTYYFQFPLYGIFLWNPTVEAYLAYWTPWGDFQFPLYGIFLWNAIRQAIIKYIQNHTFNSLYMGFFSETGLGSFGDNPPGFRHFTFNSLYMGFFSENPVPPYASSSKILELSRWAWSGDTTEGFLILTYSSRWIKQLKRRIDG